MTCSLCGTDQHGPFKCHLIKAFEYYEDGTVKRTEFVTFADFYNQQPLEYIKPTHGTHQ